MKKAKNILEGIIFQHTTQCFYFIRKCYLRYTVTKKVYAEDRFQIYVTFL